MKKRSRFLFSISLIVAGIAVAAYLQVTLNGSSSVAATTLARQDLKSSGLADRAPVEGILRRSDGTGVAYRIMVGRMYDFPVDYRQHVAGYVNQRLRERAMGAYELVWVDRATPTERLRLRVIEASTPLTAIAGLLCLVGVFGLFRSILRAITAAGRATAAKTAGLARGIKELGPIRSMRKKIKTLEAENRRLQEELSGVTHFWEITSNDLQEVKIRHKRTLQENKALKERLRLSLRQIGFLEDRTLVNKLATKANPQDTSISEVDFVEDEAPEAAEITTVATTASDEGTPHDQGS